MSVVVVLNACGGGSESAPFNPDNQIDDYRFTTKTDVPLASEIQSDIATVSGINVPIAISISSGSYYRINSGTYTDNNGTISNGDTLQVLHISSSSSNTSVSTLLTIGDINGTFTSTTGLKDTIPDSFSFTSDTNVMRYGLIESNVTAISGINSETTISISSGSSYRINGGLYTDYNGTLTNGDTVQVRHVSSAEFNTSVTSTVTIGSISNTFTSRTLEKNITIFTSFDVTAYGAIGDGDTNDTNAIDKAIEAAQKVPNGQVYFPDGNYTYESLKNANGAKFVGQSKEGTIIRDTKIREHTVYGAENITFHNFTYSDYNSPKARIFKNCKFKVTVPVSETYTFFSSGFYSEGADTEFINCDFIFPTDSKIYVGLWIHKYNSVLILNCTFIGNAWHNIQLDTPSKRDAQISIIDNNITGGITGIFMGSNRSYTFEGGLIQGNRLFNQSEESIGLDGLGNNKSRVPVIANGPISDVWNDYDGRLVISMSQMLLYDADAPGLSAPSPVSLRDDWNNFYFSFGEGSGLEGVVVQIKAFNASNNTLTLDTFTSAIHVNTGGDAGVQSGFFNWIIRGNVIDNAMITPHGQGGDILWPTAISAYLNVFGTVVENNTLSNSVHGLNLIGGKMLSTYRTLAYGNVVRNNTFKYLDPKYPVDASQSGNDGAVVIASFYEGPPQYNNQFINNTVERGRIYIEKQKFFTYKENNLSNTVDVSIK